ncbi:MAG: response regulator transcription factor [Planctomycetota bacterium]
MTKQCRILLVDDHALVRDALAERLMREPDLIVAAVAPDAKEALARVADSAPDLILMDIDMPGMLCFEAARRVTESHPAVKIIFLSAFFHDAYIDQALAVRAHGYVTKSESPDVVVSAIREVLSGGAYFSEEVRSRIVVDGSGLRLGAGARSRSATLSRREMEMLRYVAQGWNKKLIALRNNISVKTVDNHISSIMEKLDIHTTVDLVRFAIREGLADA